MIVWVLLKILVKWKRDIKIKLVKILLVKNKNYNIREKYLL